MNPHISPIPRILYVDHTASLSGGELALLRLVRRIDRRLFQPVVLLFSDGPLRQQLQFTGVETHLLPLSKAVLNARRASLGGSALTRIRDIASSILFIARVARFIRRHNISLVHTNSLKADILAGLAARMTRTPLVWALHDRIADDYLPTTAACIVRFLARYLPDHLVANSNATLSALAPLNVQTSSVIYPGVNLDEFPPAPPSTAHTHAPRIGLVGRISSFKGQDVFIRAAAIIRQRFPTARFLIIGAAMFNERDYENQIHSLAKSLGLNGSVEFTGFRQDIPRLVSSLDILVHASVIGEPFGQVVAEGMAAGKPVVATNGGGIPELVLDGRTGFVVPMADANAMVDAILKLLDNPRAAADMGRAGAARVRQLFTIHQTASRFQALYTQILGLSAINVDDDSALALA